MRQIKRLQMGKNGLSLEFLAQLKSFFQKENVVKVSLLKSACRDKEKAEEIKKEILSFLGKKFTCKRVGYVLTINRFRRNMHQN